MSHANLASAHRRIKAIICQKLSIAVVKIGGQTPRRLNDTLDEPATGQSQDEGIPRSPWSTGGLG